MFAALPRPQFAAFRFGLSALATCLWPASSADQWMWRNLAANRKNRGTSPRDCTRKPQRQPLDRAATVNAVAHARERYDSVNAAREHEVDKLVDPLDRSFRNDNDVVIP
jgi:hypothetical protein